MRPELDTAEAAALLGTTNQHVRKLARERRLPHFRIGGILKFDRAEIEQFLNAAHFPAGGEAA